MIWFAHMRTPLGTSVRMGYTAVIDIGRRADLVRLAEALGSYRVEILCRDSIDDLYRLSYLDPDAVDIIENCGGDCCALVVSAQ